VLILRDRPLFGGFGLRFNPFDAFGKEALNVSTNHLTDTSVDTLPFDVAA
jgi:hypothetical protein